MWKLLPSVKCSRLCLCTRLLIESATVDFFLNLQKVSLVILKKEHQEQRTKSFSQPSPQSVTCLQGSPNPCYLTTHTNFSTIHREPNLAHVVLWDLSLTLHAQKSILMKERDKGVFWFIFCVYGWMWVQKWEHSWLRQTNAVQPSPMGTFCSVLTL